MGCRPPAEELFLYLLLADVGSAKYEREHPPGHTGLKIALHGSRGVYLICFLMEDGKLVSAFSFFHHFYLPVYIYLTVLKVEYRKRNVIYVKKV